MMVVNVFNDLPRECGLKNWFMSLGVTN